jgi:parvulin-like peptidyl-prolyl isomerase
MYRTALLAALLFSSLPAPAEIVDRIAVTVGDQIITSSDIVLSIRTAAFLNGDQPVFTADARRKAADRLVEQALLRREMMISRFPSPDGNDVNAMLASVKQQRFKDDAAYRDALAAYGITESELKPQLQWQIRLLRFIDFRFTPAIQLSATELQDYYNNDFVPRWRAKTSAQAPTLEESRNEIEQDVNAKKANDALEEWLKLARSQTRVEYHEEAFQ